LEIFNPEQAETGGDVFTSRVLDLDYREAAEKIKASIRESIGPKFHRKGAVVAMSGGIDSTVVAALCAAALGGDRTLGLFLPEHESSADSIRLGQIAAESIGIPTKTMDIGPTLEALGCYSYRLEAIRAVYPEFGEGWRSKIVLPPIGEKGRLNIFSLVVQSPEGEIKSTRLPLEPYLQLVAATNMKQRTRKLMEYYHADRLNYAVAGTPNRLEYDQGFFVKGGDGLADLKPIAHLYKTQVYALAEHLGVPEEIRRRPPTTDTYSMPQTQEEFYFALPYEKMDLCLWAHNHDVPAGEAAETIGLTREQVEFVYGDIKAKRRTTRYLHHSPILAEDVPEIDHV
jgi:NAD+ synthase